ncbi:MAG: hypothetical protein A2504_01065 [Bdellovibrionales bacterium RIFOXYD12_FULL_39_22]|nr:MAG: hypothetical protein A2385_01955 [Bdellovibrionales bacterium RIFOXYB1_FULL_39_21]OFZ42697.1 MAG: hypothetical protein A2485_10140 [Bdellovibrionales bacterium RIFOXYC12_FULL_39_17]OFZ47256.1 MAG: hypothetical protein A2404_14745 [Bdellovibrionales bacterium RIFOXYC1_FULL_39_130]OFZ73669.1 MAG: hypothetical protein A2451_01285 [Bdellovibrionales bacterium RIFOXYC2_FULL_39_8]OFZ75422.1 MAG: hypothetical protein A2560_04015 [Bdellovibrionales bacterium RIFOXYD1_FULL_39_84]OFZ93376.1 MAG:
MKSKSKSRLSSLSKDDVEAITKLADKKRNVPLIKSSQVNMRIDSDSLTKIKILAKNLGVPYTTFMAKLLLEDIERLWSILKRT